MGARIKQRALAGANLVVIDPRRIELARVPGALHLAVRPVATCRSSTRWPAPCSKKASRNTSFLRDRVDGVDAFRTFVARFRPEDVASVTGVAPELVREAARRYWN